MLWCQAEGDVPDKVCGPLPDKGHLDISSTDTYSVAENTHVNVGLH